VRSGGSGLTAAAGLRVTLQRALPNGQRLAVLICMALLLGGCESNQERSAALEKVRLAHRVVEQKGLTVTTVNPAVKVVATATVHGESGTAAVVTLLNTAKTALRDAPIAISVTGKGGTTLYANNAAGLEPSLTTVSLLPADAQTVWIDDQVQAAGTPTGVQVRVGLAPAVNGTPPQLSVAGVHVSEEPSGVVAEGTVTNHSGVSQQQLVVFVVGRREGTVVAAGRAVLPEVKAGASTQFQAYLTGNAHGAKLEASAPPTTFG
jgi:hypothetical protein